MPRRPDGSVFVEDPHAAARRLEAGTIGWRVWFGNATRHYWAVQRGRTGRLVEAQTIDGLVKKMHQMSATQASSAWPCTW